MEIPLDVSNALLLSYTATYQWELVLEFCQCHLSGSNRMYSHEDDAFSECDRWGNNPLHLASYHHAPLSVVRALIDTHQSLPTSIHRKKRLADIATHDGSTPLLIAVSTGTSSPLIIWKLLDGGSQETSYREACADMKGGTMTPLSEGFGYFKKFEQPLVVNRACSQTTKAEDCALQGYERYALENMLISMHNNFSSGDVYTEDEFMRSLSDEEKKIYTKNKIYLLEFWLCLHFILQRATCDSFEQWRLWSWKTIKQFYTYENILHEELKSLKEMVFPRQKQSSPNNLSNVARRSEQRHKKTTLQNINHDKKKEFRLLHACAATPNCPVSLVQFISHIHPEQLLERDENGLTPLHLAIKSANNIGNTNASSTQRHHACEIIRYIAHVQPKTVAVSIPIKTTRTSAIQKLNNVKNNSTLILNQNPFCYAISNNVNKNITGMEEEEKGSTDVLFCSGLDCRTLKALWKAQPESLTSRDMITHLYPFMLAASEDRSVDVIYFLLRNSPELLMM